MESMFRVVLLLLSAASCCYALQCYDCTEVDDPVAKKQMENTFLTGLGDVKRCTVLNNPTTSCSGSCTILDYKYTDTSDVSITASIRACTDEKITDEKDYMKKNCNAMKTTFEKLHYTFDDCAMSVCQTDLCNGATSKLGALWIVGILTIFIFQ